jgi:hypothetical protein
LHDGQVGREAVNPGVIMRLGSNQEVRIRDLRYAAQNLRNSLRRELASSPGAGSIIDQAFLSAKKKHEVSGASVG